MSTPMMQVRNILLTTDFSKTARKGFARAAELARKLGATIHLVHVERSLPFAAESEFEDGPRILGAALKESAADHAFDGVRVVPHLLRERSMPGVLDEFERQQAIDLVVTTTRGRTGPEREVLGSFAERLVRTATAPVLVHREEPCAREPTADAVLVPYDFSDRSRLVLPVVRFLAAEFGSRFTFFFVREIVSHQFSYYAMLDGPTALERASERFGALADEVLDGADAIFETAKGVPQLEILARLNSGEFDLVLLGTQGMPSSVAQNVMRCAPCSVLTVRGGDHPALRASAPPRLERSEVDGVLLWSAPHADSCGCPHPPDLR